MFKSKKGFFIISSTTIALLVFGTIVYISNTKYTSETVKVETAWGNVIVVADNHGERTIITIPTGIHELITEGDDYVVSFKTRKWGQSVLESIKPIN